jgi:hypothetical protein
MHVDVGEPDRRGDGPLVLDTLLHEVVCIAPDTRVTFLGFAEGGDGHR